VQFIVDGVDESDASGQEVERADAAVGDAAVPLGDFVVNVGGLEGGLVEILELGFFEPVADASLVASQSPRTDTQGKTYASALLMMEMAIPAELV